MWTSTLGWNAYQRSRKQYSLVERLTVVLSVFFLVGIFGVLWPQPARAQGLEPIAAAGHGGFFGQDGRQIPLTLGFAQLVTNQVTRLDSPIFKYSHLPARVGGVYFQTHFIRSSRRE